MRTVWVLGDQINRNIASLDGATPDNTRVLFVYSKQKITLRAWHKQRLHLVLTAMKRFAVALRNEGFEVDEREAASLAAGVRAHKKEFAPTEVSAMEPLSWNGLQMLEAEQVRVVRSNQMLCHYEDFAQWSGNAKSLRMEDFYRWQRKRLDVLMDGDGPSGGRWNFDEDNRKPPPKGKSSATVVWPELPAVELDETDAAVVDSLPDNAVGAEPIGLWATSRTDALALLHEFVDDVLPRFGPYEDAMLTTQPRMEHSMLSHALNIGLLLPGEVVDAAEEAYRSGKAPIASVEGFVRQIIGWREYIWNVYWRWMPEYRDKNELGNERPLPPVFTGEASTDMHCLDVTLQDIDERAWVHHIPRLMVLANFAMTAEVEPWAMTRWMWERFVDGAEWVMLPNVIGMGMYADGGRMSTKPYAAGGAYINRMSDYCKSCKFDPRKRTGDDACPYTTLYWDFLARNRSRFEANHRMIRQVRNLDRLDVPAIRSRARQVLKMLDEGKL